MPDAKIAIVINDNTLEAIAQAEETWPEQKGNRSALLRKIAADWLYNKQGNSKRASLVRIEEQIEGILKVQAEYTVIMGQVVDALAAQGLKIGEIADLLVCTAEQVAELYEAHAAGEVRG